MCPKKAANAHEARRDLKERAHAGEAKRPAPGLTKANAHEARRDLKERAHAGGAKRPAAGPHQGERT
ncbi:hypothetical protein B2I21_24250 [Chryseobacterium mucoviscidosis]|nr:hypothetical protein B2I21_24250 [Chryseobacterium mucoviscidosis]